jgi:hypothetical protein
VKALKGSRCKPWDDRELDIIESFRAISFCLVQVTATSIYLTQGSVNDFWKMADFSQQIFFTII